MSKLYVMNGTDKGRSFDLKGDMTYVGRSPENDIQIKEKTISRKHLKILLKADKIFVEDLKSTNGTFIEGTPLSPGVEIELEEGVPISIGKVLVCLGKVYSGHALATPDAIDLSRDFGEKLAGHLENRPSTFQKNMTLIYRVCNLLIKPLELYELLEKMLNYICDLLGRVDRGIIILYEPGTDNIAEIITRFRESSDDTIMMYSRTVVERVKREGKPIFYSDTHFEDEDADLSESLKLMKIRSVMCIPFICRSNFYGLIYLDSVNTAIGFRREDFDLMVALSSPAALVLENARLHSKLEQTAL